MTKEKRSRADLTALLVLVLCVALAVIAGPAAAAKKKKKIPKSVTVSNNVARSIPDRNNGPPIRWGVLETNLNVGKKFKGQTVKKVEVTFQTTGDAANAANDLDFYVTAPNGRTMGLYWETPLLSGQSIGPLTLTPDSPVRICNSATPPCADPFSTLNRPYAGTAGEPFLALFQGVPMRGTWKFIVTDDGLNDLSVLNRVTLKITRQ